MRLVNTDILALDGSVTADQALQIFRQLTDDAASFLSQGWTAEEIFWNRYFWFGAFVRLETARKGSDAGLEQQFFKLVETPLPECLPDWSLLEEVGARAAEVK